MAAQEGKPNKSSDASRFGTCGHQIAEECLLSGADPRLYVGRKMLFWTAVVDGEVKGGEDWSEKFDDDGMGGVQAPHGGQIVAEQVVTVEMAEGVNAYVTFVRNYLATHGGELLVEQAVPIDHLTCETGATGMTDVAIINGSQLTIIDLKMGRGRVKAYDVIEESKPDPFTGQPLPPRLRMNLQLAMYALGTYREHSLFHGFERVKVIIVQPMLNAVSEYECSVAELLALGEWIRERAEKTRTDPEFSPSSDNCFFCRARFDCHARNAEVLSLAVDGFDDVATAKPRVVNLPQLGDMWRMVDFVRQWADDIETRVQEELAAGRKVALSDGQTLKLVEGRKGHKKWDDESAVEQMLKKEFRLRDDVVYSRKLISPTQAAEIAITQKGKRPENDTKKYAIGKVQWAKLAQHITQPDGKPVIAFNNDPRPALKSKAADMPDQAPVDDGSDLFS